MDKKSEYPSPPYLRPYVLGVAAIVAVMGAIVVIDQNRQGTRSMEEFAFPPGKMQVAGGGSPAQSGAGDPAEAGLPRVGVYDMMDGKNDTAAIDAQSVEVAVRPMPLPPPAKPEAASKAAPQMVLRAAIPAPQSLAEMVTEAVDNTAPEPVAKAAPKAEPKAALKAAPKLAPEPAPVTATIAPKASAPPPVSASKSMDKKKEKIAVSAYTLQVAAFSKKPMAEELSNRLSGSGFKSYLVEVDLGSKGTWWRVRVGHYPSEHAAKWARLDLVKEGLSPIVVHDGAAKP